MLNRSEKGLEEKEKEEEKLIDLLIFKTETVERAEVNFEEEDKYRPEGGTNVYNLNEEKMSHIGGEPCFVFKAGDPEPKVWSRNDKKFGPHDYFTIRHEETTLAGIASMLGIQGAGSLKKKQWAIIIFVIVMFIVGFMVLKPKLTSILTLTGVMF